MVTKLPVLLLLLLLNKKVLTVQGCGKCLCCKNGPSRCYSGDCLDGCVDGYTGRGCTHSCIENCLRCTSDRYCDMCHTGYFGYDCEKCPDNCNSCSSKSSCDVCKDGYYIGWQNYVYDCRMKCPENCKSCTSFDVCTSCQDGYYSGKQYTSSPSSYDDCRHHCRDSCKSCTSYDVCTQCKDGRYNSVSVKDCSYTCISTCKACSTYHTCTKCETGKYGTYCHLKCEDGCLNHECDVRTGTCSCAPGFQGERCDLCEAGLFGTDCDRVCPANCLNKICNIHGMCNHCVTGTYGTTCDKSCPRGCKYNSCSRDGSCTGGCKTGFVGKNCDQCVDGKYGFECEQDCPDSCITCSNYTLCTQCNTGYWGDNCQSCPNNCFSCSSSSDCLSCKTRFYGHICNAPCPSNCEDGICDNTNGSCLTCISGYHGSNCNKTCPQNCEDNVCKIDGKCNSCKYGYYGDACASKCEGNCVECHKSDGSCTKCIDGYYGLSCEVKCPAYCEEAAYCSISDGSCSKCAVGFYYTQNGKNCNNRCYANCNTCNTNSWMCTKCREGKYGYYMGRSYFTCNIDCSQTCLNITCDGSSGYCTHGCVSGYWGNTCNWQCPSNCKYRKCFITNGTCTSGCEDGYTGSKCKCPVNCICNSYRRCYKCKDGFYNTGKDCSCSREFCSDPSCFRCSNATVYALDGACCSCSSKCKGKKCDSENKCTNGCVDGYYSEDCSAECRGRDSNCLKCNRDSGSLDITCLTCKPGYYPDDTTFKCRICSSNCGNETCDPITGTCSEGCKKGHWGDRCEKDCITSCLECNRGTGECSLCTNGKYAKNCSRKCSSRCNVTNNEKICAIEDGKCLNGCETQTTYGSYCDKDCSLNCGNNTCDWQTGKCDDGCMSNFYGDYCNNTCSVHCSGDEKEDRICDEINGHCIYGCEEGYYGGTCEQECSGHCVNMTCNRNTGDCIHGCAKKYTGSRCTTVLGLTDEHSTVTIGASAGVSVFVVLLIAVIVVLVILKRRRREIKQTDVGANDTNDDAVTYSEILTAASENEVNDTEAVYAKPNKPKKTYVNLPLSGDVDKTKPSSDPSFENGIVTNAAIYENTVMRSPKTCVAKEYPRLLTESTLEMEEDLSSLAALRHSELMTGPQSGLPDEAATYYNVEAVRKRRVTVNQLGEYVSKKKKEDFEAEFLQLPPGLIKPYTESQKRQNMSKNRYKGIYPYDKTRVVLEDGDSDYINASYIDGYCKNQAYIASIGPTTKYMGDMSAFWRMVWQEKVGKIVMLTRLSEAGVSKCDQYWPFKDDCQMFADIQVKCQREDHYAEYTVRYFVAEKGSEKRSISQVHFTAWPDKGIPDDVTSLVECRQKTTDIKTKLDGPLLVHCSAGIGRTGTFIAMDSLTLEGEAEGGVDIYACVRNLREQRVNMVQTAEQYGFLHNALVHTLTLNSNPVEVSKFHEYMKTHTDDQLAAQFQKLQDCLEARLNEEIEAVKRNKQLAGKNREGADIPGDHNRPKLHLGKHAGASDYINALYVNSFKSEDRYILAQTPLPDNVEDFLALILQENVVCVIDMESNTTTDESVGVYHPAENQTLRKGNFTIKAEPFDKTDHYIVRKLHIKHHGKAGTKEITVKHIQYTKWRKDERIPEELAEFVQFVKDIELKYCGGNTDGPLLVHCLTGAEKSGLFCVMSVLFEKLQMDKLLNVVNTVRQVKYRRRMAIPNKEQYMFCYRCLNEYLKSFDTYANFALQEKETVCK